MMKAKDPVSAYTHLAGLVAASFGVVWLLGNAPEAGASAFALATYGVCLVVLYLASTVYHLVSGSERTERRLRLFDHIAIFLMVAGTCTPLFDRGLEGTARVTMLAGIWLVAAAGIVMKLVWRGAPRWLYTGVYVAMGWSVVLQWPRIARALPASALALVVAGGVTYTAGAVVYALRRPNPFPRIFGFHEIWHLFVLAGSALHFAAIAELARPA